MKFKESDLSFLEGSSFSNGHKIDIGKNIKPVDRISLVSEEVKNQSVLHFGCVDHLPLIESKIKKGIWLHEIITRESSKCIGIDINEEGINFIRDSLGYTNVVATNILEDEIPDEILNVHWDYLFLGEIVEHLDNPVSFLKKITEKIKFKKIIITTPNAFNLNNIKHIFSGTELINSDHRFWFTPYTISKILINSGFNDIDFKFCPLFPFSKRITGRLKTRIFTRLPALNSTLYVTAKVK